MFWIFILLVSLAWTFMKLGAATVLVKVLAGALIVAMSAILLMGVWWVGRKLFAR